MKSPSNSQQSILLLSNFHIFVHSLVKYHKKISMLIIDQQKLFRSFAIDGQFKCIYEV